MSDIKDFCPLWGEWELVGELGHGSFGTVWKVKRNDIGGKVYYAAVKHISIPQDESEIDRLISEGIFSDSDSAVYYYRHRLQSVRDEIDAMYKLRGYTNIVTYEDHKIIEKPGGIGYDLFLRMELLTPLIERIKQGMNVDDVVSLGQDIASAIKVLSDHQMIHRDIKPQNIFVNDHGDYKLGDYGTARALGTEATAMSRKGTYNYMSPEIYNNEKADIRADIYSLGLVLYRLLNGDKLPFFPYDKRVTSEDSDNAVLVRMKGEVPIPPPRYADSELSAIVLKACAFKPEDRYRSAEEMIRDLEKYQNKENKTIPGTDPDKTVTDTHGYTFDTPPWKNRTGTNEAGNVDENDDATVGDDNKHNMEKETPVPQPAPLPPESTLPSKRKWIIPLAVVLLIGVLIGALRLAGIIGSDKPSERVSMMNGTDDPQTEKPIVTVKDVITAEPIATSSDLVTTSPTETMKPKNDNNTHMHNWQVATCTEPKTCIICGDTEGNALGHNWQAATCTKPKTCETCGATEGNALGHNWQAATCTKPKTCKICGATEGNALGHNWQAATCTKPKTCKTCGATEGNALGHNWQAATCTKPKTCKTCGTTDGKALGHNWLAATCTKPKTCKTCGATEGNALGHNWSAATCTKGQTCSKCGATNGSALGHNWSAATCTKAKTCTRCGATDGSALGHNWQAATCTKPKTCTRCGATDGKALGHKWTTTKPKTCTRCGATK